MKRVLCASYMAVHNNSIKADADTLKLSKGEIRKLVMEE